MNNIKFGTIKFFKAEKGFGFITPDEAQEGDADMFYHQNARSFVVERDGQPDFLGEFKRPDSPNLRLPEKGDRVVYVEGPAPKGVKAVHWGYEEDWKAVASACAATTRCVFKSTPPPEVSFPTTTDRWNSDPDSEPHQKDGRNHGRPDGKTRRGKRDGKSQRRR